MFDYQSIESLSFSELQERFSFQEPVSSVSSADQNLIEETPKELADIYFQVNESQEKGDLRRLESALNNLVVYSENNFIGYNKSFGTNSIMKVVFTCLMPSYKIGIRKCVLGFLANIFAQEESPFVPVFVDQGIIGVLNRIIGEMKKELNNICILCLVSIASDKEEYKDMVLRMIPLSYLESILSSGSADEKKSAVKLLRAYAMYPSTPDIAESIFKLIKRGISMTNQALLKGFFKVSISFAQTENGLVNILKDDVFLSFCESKLIDEKYTSISLILLDTLLSNSSVCVDYNYSSLFSLIIMPKDNIAALSLQVLYNAVIAHPSLCEEMTELNNIKKLESSIKMNDGKAKKNGILLTTALIRLSNNHQVRCFVSEDLVTEMIDSLYLEDEETIDSVFCALYRLFQNDIFNSDSNYFSKLFLDGNGMDAIQSLIECESESLSKLAQTFKSICLAKPKVRIPFNFNQKM